ncbi:putative Reticuline oxidase-like protein [Halenospora varia]|nr:putative Reticuline oxidase-like protein [Halenospora varia]
MGQAPSTPLNQCLITATRGNVAFPSDLAYKLVDVHPYNLDVSVSPVAITYPETAAQVGEVVKCAGKTNKIQARCGGHSYANYALGGGDQNTIVVDLKNFKQFSMNENTWEATIGGGTKLADVTSKLISAGNRAIAHGTCPDVGIGGHATMGGLGPTSRMWGSSLDHVVGMEVVVANGSVVTASDTQNPDLFWAMKGAGSSFGIVTEFKFRTHAAPGSSVQYSYTFNGRPYTNHANRFKAWQKLISDPGLSQKFASQVIITELGMIISGTYFGTQAEFNALNITSVFPDHSDFSTIVFNDFAGLVGHWAEDVALNIGGSIPAPFYSKNLAFTPSTLIPEDTIDKFFKFLDDAKKGTIIWFAIFDVEGGAINEVASDATAYGHRDALFYLQTYAVNLGGVTETTRNFVTGMNTVLMSGFPGQTLGSYAGYVDPALQNPQQRYYGPNLGKLTTLKSQFDPYDVFHNPQSIRG